MIRVMGNTPDNLPPNKLIMDIRESQENESNDDQNKVKSVRQLSTNLDLLP